MIPDKEYSIKKKTIARKGKKAFEKDYRAILGDSTSEVIGSGSRYQIDATVADVYLVSRYNRYLILEGLMKKNGGINLKKRMKITISSLIMIVMILSQVSHVSLAEEANYFPFVIPFDDASDNAINVGKFVVEAPAGKHGFLKTSGDHLYFEDGTRFKIWGANMSFSGNFPTHENAEKIAAHLAKYGFNAIRMHHMDSEREPGGIFVKNGKDTLTLSPTQMERMDYFVCQLKKNGVYVDINLHVGRQFTEADGVYDAAKLPKQSKVVNMFDAKIIELQKDYAEKLLGHTNQYTGIKYSEDPAVALVEITNENSIFNAVYDDGVLGNESSVQRLTPYYVAELDRLWNEWLVKKYEIDDNIRVSWNKSSELGTNLILNSGFEEPLNGTWVKEIHGSPGISAKIETVSDDKFSGNNSLRADVYSLGEQSYMIQFKQVGFTLENGKYYTIKFKAKADSPRELPVNCMKDSGTYINRGLASKVDLNTTWQEYKLGFIANNINDSDTRVSFGFGNKVGTVWLDDVEFFEGGAIGLKEGESLQNKNISRGSFKDKTSSSIEKMADTVEFYYELEKRYFREMIDYLHNDMGIKVPVITSTGFTNVPHLFALAEGDVMDAHSYWDHPSFPNKPWDSMDFKQNNTSLIRVNGTATAPAYTFIGGLSKSAVQGKPMVITEWNHSNPNDYEYELPSLITAYASLQDWDGLFIYAYSHNGNYNDNKINAYFDIVNNPGKMAQMAACSLAFLRSDFKPANNELVMNYNYSEMMKNRAIATSNSSSSYDIIGQLPAYTPFIYKIRKGLHDQILTTKAEELLSSREINKINAEKNHKSDTNEIFWNVSESGKEHVIYNTKKFQGADGFISGRRMETDNLIMNVDNDCSVNMVSLSDNDLGDEGKYLLTVVGKQKNTDQTKNSKTNGIISWGKGPSLMEKITGNITIKANDSIKKIRVYALDSKGDRMNRIETSIKNNNASFNLGEVATPFYEISMELGKEEKDKVRWPGFVRQPG